jgi:hypothetical protein
MSRRSARRYPRDRGSVFFLECPLRPAEEIRIRSADRCIKSACAMAGRSSWYHAFRVTRTGSPGLSPIAQHESVGATILERHS